MIGEIGALLNSGLERHGRTCPHSHTGKPTLQQRTADIIRIRWHGARAPELGHGLRACADVLSEAGWDFSTGDR
jgi:hypothetical protein